MGLCDLKGRDCIEKNSWKSFDCNTTCVGIYADVQFVEKNMKDKLKVKKTKETSESDFKVKFDEGSAMLLKSLRSLEQVSYGYDTSNFVDINKKLNEGSTMLLKRLLDLENEVKLLRSGVPQQINEELLKRGVGENGRELDKDKYNVMIAEYMKFKAKHVKHFRFSSTANSTAFGKTFSIYSKPFSVSFIDV